MSLITLHFILYNELIRVVVTLIFRACRIKKGRKTSRRTIRRRARRENHTIASTARAERRSIGKCHLKFAEQLLFPTMHVLNITLSKLSVSEQSSMKILL